MADHSRSVARLAPVAAAGARGYGLWLVGSAAAKSHQPLLLVDTLAQVGLAYEVAWGLSLVGIAAEAAVGVALLIGGGRGKYWAGVGCTLAVMLILGQSLTESLLERGHGTCGCMGSWAFPTAVLLAGNGIGLLLCGTHFLWQVRGTDTSGSVQSWLAVGIAVALTTVAAASLRGDATDEFVLRRVREAVRSNQRVFGVVGEPKCVDCARAAARALRTSQRHAGTCVVVYPRTEEALRGRRDTQGCKVVFVPTAVWWRLRRGQVFRTFETNGGRLDWDL